MSNKSDTIPETVEKLAASTRELAAGFEAIHLHIQSGKALDGDLEAANEALESLNQITRKTRKLWENMRDASWQKQDTHYDIEQARAEGTMRPKEA